MCLWSNFFEALEETTLAGRTTATISPGGTSPALALRGNSWKEKLISCDYIYLDGREEERDWIFAAQAEC